ncbi:MAG: hypothetical protein R3Y44_01415 [Rikenellaceae bacterium]
MVEVKIDGIACDFELDEPLALSYNSDDLVDLESGRTGVVLEFRMPINSVNSAIFGFEGDIHPQVKFNSEWHPMSVEADGIEIFSGTAYLMQVLWGQAERYLVVQCRGGVAQWAEDAATTLLKNIEINYTANLNEPMIKASWLSDSPVKFFPIVRDTYESEGSSVDVTGVRVARTIDDYHPFFQLSALVEAIFAMSGYTVESNTADSELFSELYMSGNYSSSESSTVAQEAMGFYAKRTDDCTTQTDLLGRVSMSPYDIYSTVGNIVDIESVEVEYECYNHGNCLQIDNKALIYKPLTQVSVGFEYYLHYTCQCSIDSRTTLSGVNRLNTISDGTVSWEISNRYIDMREKQVTGIEYKTLIFDYDSSKIYRLVGYNSSGSKITAINFISKRIYSVTFTQALTGLQLEYYNGSEFVSAAEDWALYYGYVEESCTTEVKVTFRTAPHDYSPTSPMEFETQLLEGGEAETEFTLFADSSLRPYFSSYPSYNSTVTFADLAQHTYVSALDFLSSLQHLFNLRFSTNSAAKRVTIESFDQFYNGGQWDWSHKVDEVSQIEFVDLAHSAHRTNTLGYQQTDGVVQRMGQSDNLYFGEWSYEVDSYAASSGDQTLLNPLFSASTCDEQGVMVVGDRDDETMVDSLNFSPRIARFFELRDVDGENYQLPYIAFHSPDDGFTLCFEDRDGVEGLNRLRLSEVELLVRSQKISLTLKLSALDYSNLFEPNDSSPSIRSIFCFDLQGESFRTILHSIESYNPESGVAKCSFLTLD